MSVVDQIRKLMPEALVPAARKIVNAAVYARYRGDTGAAKAAHEMGFWRKRASEEGQLTNAFYERIYTELFDLDRGHFDGKKMLDIGCGPRGSLEWNSGAAERIGLDPLVDQYRELGIDRHAQTYVCSGAEKMPFEDGHFDIVAAINALDHVDDLDEVVREVTRVLRPGGDFLFLVEVGHAPTITEPIGLWWDDIARFREHFDVVLEKHFEKTEPGLGSVYNGTVFDHGRVGRREGFLLARLRRRG